MNERVALITGASGGIGGAVAKSLANSVSALVLCGRNASKLQQLQTELQNNNESLSLTTHCFDVTDEQSINHVFKQVHQQHKRLDVLVNCAGQMFESPLMMTSLAQVQESFAVNTFSALQCSQLAARLMARQQSGSIINMSSVVATQGASGQAVYSASKSALHGLTKSLAKELAATGVRVNAVAPGFIDTELVAHYSDEQRQKIAAATALGRVGEAQDVAELVAFLASDAASYITGQVIAVDGLLQL